MDSALEANKQTNGHRVRTLAEQVGLAQQVANARLTLRLIAECATPVVLP